ncbi:MAG: hypothetical protein GX774_12690 [Armatimonadetes bacterium]|nr:hypothetical protein [Armatimonadota bacterium]
MGKARSAGLVAAAVLMAAVLACAATEKEEWLTGGPLAGLRLPDFAEGEAPEVELYPGSVEHYRAYMTKYVPVRSFFDRQSLRRNWVVPAIPGAEGAPVEQYRPPCRAPDGDPVPVLRCRPGSPLLKLDLGTLEIGLYAVRLIGAVEPAKLRRFREPLYVAMRVNDGPAGQVNTYRLRIGYVDDFYSVAEIYFHAPARRRYQAELFVDRGSTVDLLLHNVTLDDVLAGTVRRPLKQRTTLHAEQPLGKERIPSLERLPSLSAQERLARDAALWRWLPPINAQGAWLDLNVEVPGVAQGTGDPREAEYGSWEAVDNLSAELGGLLRYDPELYDAFLENRKLGLRYTVEDLIARRPLPDPYPYKDDGAGLFFPDPTNPDRGYQFAPIAYAVGMRLRAAVRAIEGGAELWRRTGNREIARDAAVTLIRLAYQYPAIDSANWLACLTAIPGAYDRDLRCRQREEMARWLPDYSGYLKPLYAYDALFDTIQGNEELARSIGRFVPWVRTSEDLIELLDVYLVQTQAKRIMRYHDHSEPTALANVAAVLGDTSVTDPYLEWLFTRTFVYPLNPCGIQDLMVSGCDRHGTQYIGSTFYAQGDGAATSAATLSRYLAAGGNPQFDLSRAEISPKPLAQCRWQLDIMVAGLDFARIGDVCGPDKAPGATLPALIEASQRGWQWSRDPRFAWVLAHLAGPEEVPRAEWAAIEAAAAQVRRAPWLDNRSRVVSNWFGVLETGLEHDDYRFRRAAYVRTGIGMGHQHADTLDLQVVAHGLPMTIDGGQRSGYSEPNDRFSRVHNVVEVNGQGNEEYGLRSPAWVQTLSDAPGARYLQANAVPPDAARLFYRQVALLDVDEGANSHRLPVSLQVPGSRLDPGAVTGNSYVFDVFRVSGGQTHAYCFHGPVNDDFAWNAENVVPVSSVKPRFDVESDVGYLSLFAPYPNGKLAGTAPATLQATWRYTRDGKVGSEQQMLGENYQAASPRKFTRLHLLGAAGLRALRAESVSEKFDYHYTNLMALRRGEALESAFTAIIEPFAGEPFITSCRLLPVAGNETDALRAAAVAVQTRNGHRDLCFADGRPESVRQIGAGETGGAYRVAGEFAYYSVDAAGLRQAALTGGTLLEGPHLRLRTAARRRTARVTGVNYPEQSLRIDAAWPEAAAGRAFTIGSPQWTTTYTVTAVRPADGGSTLTLDGGADCYRSPIREVDAAAGRVRCAIDFNPGGPKQPAKNRVASNDQLTRFWRAEQVSGDTFRLTGRPVSEADFAPSGVLRLWEYGVGDTLAQSAYVGLRRVEEGVYELVGDVDVTVALKVRALAISTDRESWKRLEGRREGDWLAVTIDAGAFAAGAVYLKEEAAPAM